APPGGGLSGPLPPSPPGQGALTRTSRRRVAPARAGRRAALPGRVRPAVSRPGPVLAPTLRRAPRRGGVHVVHGRASPTPTSRPAVSPPCPDSPRAAGLSNPGVH